MKKKIQLAQNLRKRVTEMLKKNEKIEEIQNTNCKNLDRLKIGHKIYCQDMRNK